MKLLVLSNGHGEDIIAIRIIERLLEDAELEITALPIVGQGYAYQKLNIPLAGRVQQMPSGGFIYKGGAPLWQDLQGGLISLTSEQLKLVRQWGKDGGKILAVGDIVPLLYAWVSQAEYAFVGTAKSEYYLRDELGWLPQTSLIERKSNSVYLPWERWLMKRDRCRAVFPRDSLTTEVLQQSGITAYDLGNPMMDGLTNVDQERKADRLDVLLLPGSRMPEAIRNWQQILIGVWSSIEALPHKLSFNAAIAPGVDLKPFVIDALTKGWSVTARQEETVILAQNSHILTLSKEYNLKFYAQSDVALAMAGTATEQFVGLGKPVVIFPGSGPQFTPAFAEAQSRLLGCSISMVESPSLSGAAIANIIDDEQQLSKIAANGLRRMGTSGSATRIAAHLHQTLLAK